MMYNRFAWEELLDNAMLAEILYSTFINYAKNHTVELCNRSIVFPSEELLDNGTLAEMVEDETDEMHHALHCTDRLSTIVAHMKTVPPQSQCRPIPHIFSTTCCTTDISVTPFFDS